MKWDNEMNVSRRPEKLVPYLADSEHKPSLCNNYEAVFCKLP